MVADDGSQNGTQAALGSDWGGLSAHLIATFFAVKKSNSSDDKTAIRWERDMSQPEVRAPLTDGNVETTLNWQSPFENTGIDQKFSSFSAMLQSGGFSDIISELQKSMPAFAGKLDPLGQQVKTLEGKSNLTKLNSTQVFQGMPPIKVSVTAHFRAFKDAREEVRDPVNQLMAWALPQEIKPNGPAASLAGGNLEVFASRVPQIIGMRYADILFAPLVIEAIPYPLTGPRDSNGVMTHAALTLQLATLTALDKQDWRTATNGSALAQFKY